MDILIEAHRAFQVTNLPNHEFPTNKVPVSPLAGVYVEIRRVRAGASCKSLPATDPVSSSDGAEDARDASSSWWCYGVVMSESGVVGAAAPVFALTHAHFLQSVILSSCFQRSLAPLPELPLGPVRCVLSHSPSSTVADSTTSPSSGSKFDVLLVAHSLSNDPAVPPINIPTQSQSNTELQCSFNGASDAPLSPLEVLASVPKCTRLTTQSWSPGSAAPITACGQSSKYGFKHRRGGPVNRWGIPIGLGLAGGGETAAANGWGGGGTQTAAGWGNQAGSVPSGTSQWGSGRTPGGSGSTGPPSGSAGGMKQAPTAAASTAQSGANMTSSSGSGSGATAASNWGANKASNSNEASKRHKDLQNIREALLSCEGWGGENVNQDTSWDLPASPEPSKDAPTQQWKLVNNGTELWENNLRNGGAPPPKPQQAPWGHTPATNYGGTWGEDDDQSDTSNAWNPAAPPPTPGTGPQPQWPSAATAAAAVAAAAVANAGPNMWNQQKKPTDWQGAQPGWPDHAGPPRAGIEPGPDGWPHGPPKIPGHMPPHGNAPVGPPGGLHGPPHMAPHGIHPGAHVPPHVGHHGGPPGRTHGAAHHLNGPPGPGMPGAGGVWGSKDIKVGGSGWDEPTGAGMPRRGDDGTAVWGNPQQQPQGNVSRWKEQQQQQQMQNNPAVMMAAAAGLQQQQPPPPPQQQRMPPPHLGGPQQQPPPKQPPTPGGAPMWAHHGRNGNWGEPPHDSAAGAGVWSDDAKGAVWGADQASPSWNNKPKIAHGAAGGWQDPEMEGLAAQYKGGGASGSNGPAQVRALMQHIQIAVQAGYLNPQILNQSLAPTTLVLLNSMLSQINMLHKLNQQVNSLPPQPPHSNNSAILQLNIHIAKTKQQINNIQNQIASQQAQYLRQQQQQQQQQQQPQPVMGPPKPAAGPPNDFFKTGGLPDQFTGAFGQMNISDQLGLPQQAPPQSSRLNREWKVTPTDADESLAPDFMRAPGAPGKQPPSQSNISLIFNSPWSQTPVNRDNSGWPQSSSTGAGSAADGDKGTSILDSWAPSATQPSNVPVAAAVAPNYDLDIKPFEPGKRWMTKNIEDDPTITPGSVTPSPLLAPMTKASSSISSELPTLPLTSSTWSNNPQQHGDAIKNGKTNVWSDGSSSSITSDLWSSIGTTKPGSGGPPGLASSSAGAMWGGLGRSAWLGDQRTSQANSTSALQQQSQSGWPLPLATSTWLILKNLTPQIDGSTLKTLCMQHGPLVNFHLALNKGLALVNYATREEACKAQGNLNNCVLINTTIWAEFASDHEVKQLLGGQQGGSGNSAGGGPSTPGATPLSWGNTSNDPRGSTPTSSGSKVDTWSTGGANLWGNSGSNGGGSLWGGTALSDAANDPQQRATPSSLKTFLPDGLLTSESGM